jgi:hypothetical protein
MREIRTSGSMSGKVETEQGEAAKAPATERAGNCYASPTPPRHFPTLPFVFRPTPRAARHRTSAICRLSFVFACLDSGRLVIDNQGLATTRLAAPNRGPPNRSITARDESLTYKNNYRLKSTIFVGRHA